MIQHRLSYLKLKMSRILVFLLVMNICLVSTVTAIGLSPLSMDITVEKGKETEIVRNIQVSNPEETPIHIVASVTGSIAEFVTLEPAEFDLSAGPGIHSTEARPYKWVKVTFTIPREVPETNYNGEILFTQQPVGGGVLGAAAQLGIYVTLNIGTMALAEFPVYIMVMMFVLIVLLILSIGYKRRSV